MCGQDGKTGTSKPGNSTLSRGLFPKKGVLPCKGEKEREDVIGFYIGSKYRNFR